MEDLIILHDLDVLNEGSTPTFDCHIGRTIPDVSLVTPSLRPRVSNWTVSERETSSDHRLIEFKLHLTQEPPALTRNLRKADWSLFQMKVQEKLYDHQTPNEWDRATIEGQVSLFNDAIKYGLDDAAPLRQRRIRYRSPCWSEEVINARNKCKEIFKSKGNAAWTEDLHNQYLDAKKEKRRAIRNSNKKNWMKFTSETADPNGAASLMRIIRKDVYVPPTLLKEDGNYTNSKKETIQALLSTHFPGSTPADDEAMHHDATIGFEDDIDGKVKLNRIQWINEARVRRAIASFSDFKASGPDEIKPIMLKKLPDKAIELLNAIYTACVQLSYTPKVWTESRTVFIPKPGKDDYSIPKAFRPISLTSFCFKTLERLILWNLEATTFRTNPLHERQHAFRKGHSTETALSQVVDQIEEAIYNGRQAMAVFLDIEGAFDNLNTDSAVKAMEKHKIPDQVIKWYSYYLRNRTSAVQYGNKKEQRLLTRGTPQGGVLSPILWNMAFDELLQLYDKGPVSIYGFADDACLVTTAYGISQNKQVMQAALNKAIPWGVKHGLKFSPKKTIAMRFAKGWGTNATPSPLKLGENDIPWEDETRYLGVILDSKLSWHSHILHKTKKAKQLLFKMKSALGVTWGPKPHLMRWIYTGIVRPAITYGSIVWAHALRFKHHRQKLKRINALLLRMMGPKRKSTPIAGMEMIAYTPPLDLYAMGEAVKGYIRNRHHLPEKRRDMWQY